MKIFFTLFFGAVIFSTACKQKNPQATTANENSLNLKRGKVILCGPADSQFGVLAFETSCGISVQTDIDFAVKLLHSFEYDEAEKAFAHVIDKAPACAIAYWGIAMSNFHPLWTPPTEEQLIKGAKAIQIAQSLTSSKKEKAYVNAIAAFYNNWQNITHDIRCNDFEKAMEALYRNYPADKEAAIFYALALNAAADPSDQTFVKQKKAGAILMAMYPAQPNHPGIAHYLIHTYDYPQLATQGLAAARAYANIAPSSAHALHMPSHIFTRLGFWDECIQSNLASVTSAKCYAEAAGLKGHWDEELHGLDYLVYAYLQKGDNEAAKKQWDYLNTITEVDPLNFKVAYSYAAIPARFVLENKMWAAAAKLPLAPGNFPWIKFPWQEAIVHFTRVLGAVHTNNKQLAKSELIALRQLQDTLLQLKDGYKAKQVAIQIEAAAAWILLLEGNNDNAIAAMMHAADMEDKTEKHPVTPSEVLPARELLGDMHLQLKQPKLALAAYKAVLQKHPNRFNALYSAGVAAQQHGELKKAATYFLAVQLLVGNKSSSRPEMLVVNRFLNNGF